VQVDIFLLLILAPTRIEMGFKIAEMLKFFLLKECFNMGSELWGM
jgi:hypothetical protein